MDCHCLSMKTSIDEKKKKKNRGYYTYDGNELLMTWNAFKIGMQEIVSN